MSQSEVYRIVRRRATGTGIATKIGAHTLCALGITAHLKNAGKLEVAQQMAAYEPARTTGLYYRRGADISPDGADESG